MTAHLVIDGLSGALLCGAPFVLLDEDSDVTTAFVVIGVWEIAAALMTDTRPSPSEQLS